jgi:very-short-patch-repair endonuclease
MPRPPRRVPLDPVAVQASKNQDVVTRAQLFALGVSSEAIAYRLRVGRLYRVHAGVYSLWRIQDLSVNARARAGVYACGLQAALSHRWAGAMWKLISEWPRYVEVTAPTTRRHAGLIIHRSHTLTPGDTRNFYGIPVTTVERTLIDLADVLTKDQLGSVLGTAVCDGLLSVDEITALLLTCPGRRAVWRIPPLLEDARSRSEFERRFLAFVRARNLPRPEVNQRIDGREVDMVWRRERLIVELDGWRYHDSAVSFNGDRRKTALLMTAGWTVLRLSWSQLVDDPALLATQLTALLSGAGESRASA